jgi:hypothetical protein
MRQRAKRGAIHVNMVPGQHKRGSDSAILSPLKYFNILLTWVSRFVRQSSIPVISPPCFCMAGLRLTSWAFVVRVLRVAVWMT